MYALVRRVVDADTVRLDLDLGWNVWLTGENIRLAHIDAPELSTEAGKAAKRYLEQLLPVGTLVQVVSHRRDKYGRILASLLLDAHDVTDKVLDVAELLVAAGHARGGYEGGARS